MRAACDGCQDYQPRRAPPADREVFMADLSPIADHGVTGDLRTAALVASDGSINRVLQSWVPAAAVFPT